jgi:hypothetical protein
MTTHNLIIYHCLRCGAVMHCETGEDAPECCGKPMTKAAAETIVNDRSKTLPRASDPTSGPQRPTGPERKPR